MRPPRVFLPLISVIILSCASCTSRYEHYDGYAWGTSYHIVYAGQGAEPTIDSCLQAIDRELSMFNPHSTVSRVNRGVTDTVSADFIRVFEIAKAVHEASSGAYDVTVGPLVDLWGFGRKNTKRSEPDSASIAEALSAVGLGKCSLTGVAINRKSERTVFDFSSIAKGYGIDRIGEALERAGIHDYMIEVGGEVLAKGVNPDGRPWRIQVDSPEVGPGHKAMTVKELGPARRALATSGNYRNYRTTSDGRIVGHTISPINGYPVSGSLLSATVSAATCAEADALATACMATAYPDSAIAVIRRYGHGAEALLVYHDGGIFRTLTYP